MIERFPVEAQGGLFDGLDDVPVVFHGINKSGSLAMSKVIGEALVHAGRSDDLVSHYHQSTLPLADYLELIAARTGRVFGAGHYLYGAIPPSPRRIWVTQFRHPLPRAVSVFQWLKNKHVLRHGTDEGFPNLSEFVRNSRGISHSQVMQFGRGFGPRKDSDAKKRLSAKALFEISADAIEREVYCVGIAERFEESIFLFASLCGIDSVVPWRKDVRNKGRKPVAELTSDERDLIEDVYQWDFRLYEWALEKFESQNSRIAFGPSLDRYKDACEREYGDRL